MKMLERLVSFYAPHICAGCSAEGTLLCYDCCQSIVVPSSRCYRCRLPVLLGRTCPDCRPDSSLVSLNAAAAYEGVAKELLWALKFGRAQAAAEILGGMMADRFGGLLRQDTLIVPVPTANRRVRSRGYDQAALIAQAFAGQSGCHYAPLLRRYGSQEQKRANWQQRHSQLQGVFEVRDTARVTDARIILIDDVLTTGATLEEASRTLKLAGARVVGGLVFARA